MPVARWCVMVGLMLCFLPLTGCQATDPYAKYQLGAGRDMVASAMQAIGGLARWQDVKSIEATALVTHYGADSQANIDRMTLTMDPWTGDIMAVGHSPQGRWQVTCIGGKTKFDGAAAPMNSRELCAMLQTIEQRIAGPVSLLRGQDKVVSAASARIQDIDLSRLAVRSKSLGEMAYYFDSSMLLRYLTSGSEIPGGSGTVTVYGPKENYIMLGQGLILPRKFRINHVGQTVLLSDKPVLEVELSDMVVH